MVINVTENGKELVLAVEGRLDTTTAPELEAKVQELSGVETLIFDFASLDYISSAGLRVLLSAQKKMNAAGASMIVKNCNEIVSEVFEVTGFNDVLTIQ